MSKPHRITLGVAVLLAIVVSVLTSVVVHFKTENRNLHEQVVELQLDNWDLSFENSEPDVVNNYNTGYGIGAGFDPHSDTPQSGPPVTAYPPVMDMGTQFVWSMAIGEMIYVGEEAFAYDGFDYFVDITAFGAFYAYEDRTVCVTRTNSGYSLCGQHPIWLGSVDDHTRTWEFVSLQ